MKLTARVRGIKPSPTLSMAAEAAALVAEGRDIVDLSAGEPDFDTPEHVKAAAREALAQGKTKYTAVGGTPALKDAIREKLRRDNALIYERSEGCELRKHALHSAFRRCRGDEGKPAPPPL
jgi:aspartate aminotransferase